MFIGPQAMLFSEAKTAEFALLVARTILAAPVSAATAFRSCDPIGS